MERNELCWCGSGKKYKKCHMPIRRKIMMHAERGEIVPTRKILKTPFQIEKIRKSAELNTAILDEVARQIHVGMSTQEINDIVYRFTKEHGGIPAPLNYQGFPKSVCTSINNEICMVSRMRISFWKKAILSMLTYPLFLTDIFLMHPVCSRWEKYLNVQSASSVSQKSV